MKVEYNGTIYKVLAVDFDGIAIRKDEPSVIINHNDGCISLSECKLIYPQLPDNSECPIKINTMVKFNYEDIPKEYHKHYLVDAPTTLKGRGF